MSGPTITMAPAVESPDNQVFHRAHSSSSDLITLGPLPSHARLPDLSGNQTPTTRSNPISDNTRHTLESQGSLALSSTPPLTLPASLLSSSTAAASSAAGPALLASAPSSRICADPPPSRSFSSSSASSASSASSSTTPNTTIAPRPSLADSTSKHLPSLPAFDVPSFDFDSDLDSGLELTLPKDQTPHKPADPPAPPRRVWEDYIKPADSNTTSKEKEPTSPASQFGAELEALFTSSASTSDTSSVHSSARSLFHVASDTDVGLASAELPMQRRPSTAVVSPKEHQTLEKDRDFARLIKLTRRKTITEPPLPDTDSSIAVSRSTPDFHDLLQKEREKQALKARKGKAATSSNPFKSSSLFQRSSKDEKVTDAAPIATASSSEATTLQVDGDTMGDRQRTRSASFVNFAKRSWISRSPSPSPAPSPAGRPLPTKKERDEEKKREKERVKVEKEKEREREREESAKAAPRLSRKRTVSNLFGGSSSSNSASTASIDDEAATPALPALPAASDTVAPSANASPSNGSLNGDVGTSVANADDSGTGPAGALENATQSASVSGATVAEPISIVVVPPAPTSKPFSRASGYLSRMKQRPHSMFDRAVANSASSKLSGSKDDLTSAISTFDDEGQARPSTSSSTSSSLSMSFEMLSDRGLRPFRSAGRKLGEISNSNSSTNSDDGSSESSANGSAILPASASEAESLSTADTSNNSPMAHPNSRDPHWVAFKDLETNFYKFLSKTTTAQRMIIVRATLAPFLRRFANEGLSNRLSALTPEDIERRASILNRWWTGLLEMLDAPTQPQGSNTPGQSSGLFGNGTFFGASTTVNGTFTAVSGIDRPVVLESVSMIVSRPEWRLLTKVFRPFDDQCSSKNGRADASESDDPSLFVEESAEHNVRTMFVNNLLAQLILVVGKMSTREAPLSIVNFSGKACAYAFFFVPGVADILVRLWGLEKNIDLMGRAADAFGLPRRSRTNSASVKLAANFPPGVGSLGWSSVMSTQANLRKPPKMSQLPPAYVSACSRVTWFAPCWLSRWRGADTDLLFIFTKYYHILASEFMPPSLKLSLTEKARAPGFVLLHAQLLQVFDNTIHRQAAVEAAMLIAGASVGDGTPSLWTQQQMHQRQNGVMTKADGTSGGPPLVVQPNYNLFRDMDENRIIALLRDFLASDVSIAGARDTFAEAAMMLLKAAALRTSQYDHNACYILCDFMQELLTTFDNYYGYREAKEVVVHVDGATDAASQPVDFIDWTFWLDVYKMMLNSNNTMSEIRVLSFVFATWDIATADPQRKEELCIRWLLSEEVFTKFFNNWCPMVRAYYMRLLCWRICRDCGSPSETDMRIYQLVSQRLTTVWAHYLWLKQKSDNEGLPHPTTAPSLPQPSKRFMIVRTEVNSGSQLGLLAKTNAAAIGGLGSLNPSDRAATTFDAMANSRISTSSVRSTDSIASFAIVGEEKKEASSAKKKWSLFSKVLGLGAKASVDDDFEQMRRNTAAAASASGKGDGPVPPASSDSGSSTGSAPVFDVSRFVFKFMLHNIPWQTSGAQGDISLPPAYQERVLNRPRLPAPAQLCIAARNSASTASFERRSDSVSGSRPSLGYHRGGSSFDSREWGRSQNPSPLLRAADVADAVQPVEPRGADALLRAKYAGRALAEWGLVVNECDSFVDRRRDEGVLALKDIEVPSLCVEGMRRLA